MADVDTPTRPAAPLLDLQPPQNDISVNSLNEDLTSLTLKPPTDDEEVATPIPLSFVDLCATFETSVIIPAPPEIEGDVAPPCFIANLPYEMLYHILEALIAIDPDSYLKASLVCKRLAYIIFRSESIWRIPCLSTRFGWAGMHYEFPPAWQINRDDRTYERYPSGSRFAGLSINEFPKYPMLAGEIMYDQAVTSCTDILKTKTYQGSWKRLFQRRKRIRFGGIYISKVEYERDTMNGPIRVNATAPKTVTYYRYLRFYRDGSVLSLLSCIPPEEVVPVFSRENMDQVTFYPFLVYTVPGVWRLREPWYEYDDPTPIPQGDTPEEDYDVVIETQGAEPQYRYIMHFAMRNMGQNHRNARLKWTRFGMIDPTRNGWSDFNLSREASFKFSRVKSYGYSEEDHEDPDKDS